MSSLSYICEYGSNSENSDCDSNPEDISSSKVKKTRLHVPDLSHIAVVPVEAHEDNPDVHGGRQRSFPHERGNWASFIYLKYPDEEFLSRVISTIQNKLSGLEVSYQQCDNIHLSLSKTFILKYHLISPFTTSLQKILSDIECFELSFDSVKIFCNEEKTRTFIALEVDYFSNKYLFQLSEKVDKLLEEYKLPKFYEDPSFHASLFWINGDKKNELETSLEKLNNILHQDLLHNNTAVCVTKVNCKIGNKYYQYSLQF